MTYPRWATGLAIAVIAAIGVLLALDWIADERLGAWAPYSIGAALILLMLLSFGAMPRAAATRASRSRDGGDL
ncbi:hypothetical protein A6A40_17020 (plasmid) [Azospirillum humicireducens]|uniref:Uncharacterized protein n=1 Tax=Azospirillum humicireducens TaxID=1226968 RepID=A0A2R4VQQ8_9PROT|nr:hypothetical protein [Azospirillum humicireducens]AWB06755.1 hypothetical protein A6A40_17020 [Azospirillum humicireducens]